MAGRARRDVFVTDARALPALPIASSQSLHWMSADERARFDRFRHDDDRVMFALGRLMARTLVGRALGVAPDALALARRPARPARSRSTTATACTSICRIQRGPRAVRDLARARGRHRRRRSQPRAARTAASSERYCSPAEADDIRSTATAGRIGF